MSQEPDQISETQISETEPQTAAAEQPVADSAAPAVEAPAVETAEVAAAPSEEPAKEVSEAATDGPRKIGSQRGEEEPKLKTRKRPQTPNLSGKGPAMNPEIVPHTEVPNIRRMSAELTKEVEDALSDVSLDEAMMGGATQVAGGELEIDSRRQATVMKVDAENIFFTLGGAYQGVVKALQFEEPPEVGASLDVIVNGYDADDDLYELRVPGASMIIEDWSDLAEGMVVEARVTGENKGGLECDVRHIRGFMPASQVSRYRVDDLSQFIGQTLQCVVTEARESKRNLVLSHRAVLERQQAEAKEQLLGELAEGQIREGVVRSLRDFGAFVDIGGIDGLIHISRMSWDRIKHPSEVLEEGQKVKVKVEKIDTDSGKIGLSLRDTSENPWNQVASKYPVGAIVTGTVSNIATFGAFVKLESGIEGLIHISELAHGRVFKVDDFVKEGQEVEVKVVSVDVDAQRIGLSLKATQAAPVTKTEENAAEKVATEAVEPEPVKSTVPKHTGPLKGGTDRPGGGESFGLNW